jgi:putative heme-binding domain-containing protein
VLRRLVFILVSLVVLPFAPAQKPKKPLEPGATPAEKIKIREGFKIELLYSVPREKEGSWVSMCTDPRGRLIVSDQEGGLYRITPPALDGKPADTKVEKLAVEIGEAQGLLWAFDSLYVMSNGKKYGSGLYRVRSSKGNDDLDEVKQLRSLRGGGGEHGPHAIVPSPDGKAIYVLHGNQTPLTKYERTHVPPFWGEDHLLPRLPDGNGFMRGVLGPGGAIYRVDPSGTEWELVSVGYRNPYDMAFNRHGELFTFDADMEWDFNTPWYRPTRVCLAASGSEFGWRNGAGKWPPYYPDSHPAILDIGPGSPTGVVFGYGAHFPAKYQEAFFMCDWSYGKLYAVHLTPDGSAYRGEAEEFLSGSPLPLTDIVINPKDGAMYFTIGGRRTQSGLYRVTYTGKESTQPAPADNRGAEERALRHRLEEFHGRKDDKAVETAWKYLNHPDRYIRSAARIAIEHQDPKTWQERALAEKDPQTALQALLALVRVSASDPFHRRQPQVGPPAPACDEVLRGRLLEALDHIGWEGLTNEQRLDLLRVYAIAFNRMDRPDDATCKRVIARFDPLFPAKTRELNAELCQLLVYLEAPGIVGKLLAMLASAPTQEEQLEYGRALRVLRTGWTLEQRKEYFKWFLKAGSYKGGASLQGFLRLIKDDAVATLSETEKKELKSILDMKPTGIDFTAKRPFVKKWTLAELEPIVEKGLTKRNFDRGRTLFGEAKCFACHRFANEGGANGPDLTGAAGRFSVRDLLESIVEPSKVISDQYAAVIIETKGGKTVVGRIVNLHNDTLTINTDMLNPNGNVNVDRKQIESMETSKVSMMPEGLIDTLKEDEVLDLVAFLLSRGDRGHPMFK